jgi:hypothetical protein
MTQSASPTRILFEWWEAKRGDRAMPTRAELDPAELKSILPTLILVDVRPSPSGKGHVFTYRLTGTEIDSRFGVALKGLSVEQAPFGATGPSIQSQYESVVQEGRPICCSHTLMIGERHVEYDRLAVPLSDGKGNTIALAVAVDFNCVFRIAQGRPPGCSFPEHCDRIELCLAQGLHASPLVGKLGEEQAKLRPVKPAGEG